MAKKPKAKITRTGKAQAVRIDVSVPRDCSVDRSRQLIAQRCSGLGLSFTVQDRRHSVRIIITSRTHADDTRPDTLAYRAEQCVKATRVTDDTD